MMITLVRHAEVEERYLSCYNGHIDIGLSKRGHEQAKALAEHFESNRFDAVYCSDLIRARETLSPIPLSAAPNFTNQLREKSWGRHEGKTFDEIKMMENEGYESFDQWLALLDGEDMKAYTDRIGHFFTAFLPAQEYENVLIVTHAGVVRSLMSILRKIPIEEAFGIQFGYANYVVVDTDTWQYGPVICPV
ncbi:MAG: histidine phosphatase family protein [Campylobacterota bacterium]|nr:histidine phosphatase family protein [Campylobacterota bacterium]